MYSIIGEVYLVIGVSIILLIGSISEEKRGEIERLIKKILIIAGIIILIEKGEVEIIEGKVGVNGIIKLGKAVVLVLGGIMLIGERRKEEYEYGVIMVLGLIGTLVMISGEEMMTVYIGVEIQSLAMYVLVGYRGKSSYAVEGSVKYLIIGALGSGMIIMSMSIIYGELGTIRLEEIGRLLEVGEGKIERIGVMLMIGGILFKLSVVPFHGYYVDVIEGGMKRTGKIISVIPKIGAVCIMLRVIWLTAGELREDIRIVVIGCGIMSIGVGVIGSNYQRKIRRFIGYSSISHIGYMMIGGERIVEYLMMYSILSIGIWMIIEREDKEYIESIGERLKKSRFIGGAIVIIMLGMAGIPPVLGGFMVKVGVISEVVKVGEVIAIIAMIGAIIGSYNYVRWLKSMYSGREKERVGVEEVREYSREESIIIGIIVLYVSSYSII